MKFTFGTEAHGKIAVEAKDWVDAFDRAGDVYRALDLVDAGRMKIYRLPKDGRERHLHRRRPDAKALRRN